LKTAIVYHHGGDFHALLLEEFDHIQCANREAFCEALMLAGVNQVTPARPDQMSANATVDGINIDDLNRILTRQADMGYAATHGCAL